MNLVELNGRHNVESAELAERVAESSRTSATRQFIAEDNDKEVAFVSLDFYPVHPDRPQAALYELWVVRDLRNQGYGTRLVASIEDKVRDEGYDVLIVNPKPIDGGNEAQLREWYERRGFEETESNLQLIKYL